VSKIADIYRAEILRAVLGLHAHAAKVDNPERLRQIAEHLADSELAQSALQAKGYGRGGCTFLELTREVPSYTPGMLVRMFAPRTPTSYPIPASRRTA
jgi:hypothetical protein